MDQSERPVLEDFGQRVDLTRRIREVLANYPEGTTVLKELIQNADDAGATRVCLCLDQRNHPCGSLLSPKLGEWQGPALLAYNDAVFTEDDFVSISRIGGSQKQGHAWKTGRFGVGFNSVYHLTDLPSFVSGKYVVLFDPQGVYLPNVSSANPGKRLEFVSSSAISVYNDQFFPYCAFGCDMNSPFNGTLFRFPLRNADQAAVSKLSGQAYTKDDISSMLEQLYGEAVFALLFLKNVLSVEMFVWEENGDVPRKLYSCLVDASNENIVLHRQALLRLSKSPVRQECVMDSFNLTFLSEKFSGPCVERRNDTFLVVQTMGSATSRIGSFAAAAAAKEFDLHLLPWASVAACISDDMSEVDVLKQGRAFCFLPLPLKTGLSVQVNAYFELSSNRRSIWYGEDMDRSGKLRSVWNRLLLEDVVSPTYNKLLLDLRKILVDHCLCYSLWPRGYFEEPWNILVENFYVNVCDSPVLYSDIEGGKWISPAEAFFHDAHFVKSKELMEILVLLGMPVVSIPDFIVEMLLNYASTMSQRVLHPSTVRLYLRDYITKSKLSKDQKLLLLEYCLQDLVDAEVGRHAHNLLLLPLANGEYGSFSDVSTGLSYFICNESYYEMLLPAADQLIDEEIPPYIRNRLTSIAESAKTNVKLLNIQIFLGLLPRFFPYYWKFKSRVEWDPDSCKDHPTASWFMLFWKYLRMECDSLALLNDWPILPSTSGHLYKVSKCEKLINAELLSDGVKAVLRKIGCKVLNLKYGVQHPDLLDYVYGCDGAGVIDAISDTVLSSGSFQESFFQDVTEDERNELRQFLLDPKWYLGGIITEAHITKIKKLPIYIVYGGGSNQSFDFVDLESSRKWFPPSNIVEHFLSDEFIYSPSQSESDALNRYYDIKHMSRSYFYKEKVINRISELQPEVRDPIMLTILQELPQLCFEDLSIKESLRELKFVPVHSGALKTPEMLYDPRNKELFTLLEGSDSFPCGAFQESLVLDMLQGLGLRTLISPDTILRSARQIEYEMNKDPQKANSRGKLLLSYLEVNAAKWLVNCNNDYYEKVNRLFSKLTSSAYHESNSLDYNLDKFWFDLKMISWCPVLVIPPHPSLPWPSVSSTVAPPKLVRLKTDMWLVSGSLRILDAECSSSALSLIFGWSTAPGGSVIAAQLLELGKNNEIISDQALRQELALVLPRIYCILAGMVGLDEMDIVKAVLEGSRWIWVGDGFSTEEEVVLSGPLHLAPYIRVIPADLAVFKDLFVELGVREFLGPGDYAGILCRMATRKGLSPLDTQELRAAVLIVQHLAEVYIQDLNIQIYLPDLSCILLPASDLVYNDAPWLLSGDDNANTLGSSSMISLSAKGNIQKFVHGNISIDVADKMGVCSLRRLLLAESADSMNLSLSGAVEAFGQHEDLTTRLKHIVEMYADGPGILFELVQNADDAGASEVSFLLDKTQYGTSSLLSPEMAQWQGPALYCFNSSIFSSHDLHAISRIGQDSKLEKPFAIGRFGLGFNCVYHFTDVPGFVSGENIVMFDPHAYHLPGISPSHPGLKIKFVQRKILDQFPDQFAPFLHFGCDLQNPLPGTLFRFPLRNRTAASRSQIKKEAYSPEDVLALFSSFAELISETLLFLRNVKTISVFVKDGTSREMQLLHRVVKHNVNDYLDEPCQLHPILSIFHRNEKYGVDRDQFLSQLRKTTSDHVPCNCEKVLVLEQNSSIESLHLWMISECLRSEQWKNKILYVDKKSHSFIPYASVAAYLHCFNMDDMKEESDSDDQAAREKLKSMVLNHSQVPKDNLTLTKAIEGRAFCFLPLPISTSLPAHINAYFELSSNRRDIWFGNDMAGGGKVRSDWNMLLLEEVIPPAFGHMLEKVALELGPCVSYFALWPTSLLVEPWTTVVRNFYKCVADLHLRVLFTKARGGQWITPKQAILPDFDFPRSNELVEALSDAGLPLAVVSEPVVERFVEVCPTLNFLKPQLLRNLLKRRTREFKSRSDMLVALEYCLGDIKESIPCDALCGLPLVPLANGSFSTFNKPGEGERIFVTSQIEYELLRDLVPDLIVDHTIPHSVLKTLKFIAQSDKLNLCLMSCYFTEELCHRFFPSEWLLAEQVMWNPHHSKQPNLDWMRLFWSYLKSDCVELSLFHKWPILPVQGGYLMRLVKNSNVVRNDGWSENMLSLLKKMGCYFLALDLQIDHPQLNVYVQDATAIGILNTLLTYTKIGNDVEKLFCDATEGEIHELRSFIFQLKWFQSGQMEASHIEMIKRLPIFETYKSRKLKSLVNPSKMLQPMGVLELLLDENFVRTESERESDILRTFLGMREPPLFEFYQNYVLNNMALYLSQPITLLAILQDIKSLTLKNSSLTSVLALTPFIQAADGSWKPPSRLYDPRVSGLQKLLHRKAFFPGDKFMNDTTLEILVSFGLRKTLDYIGLLDSARSVSMLHDSGDLETLIYARKLLLCLDFVASKFSLVKEDVNIEDTELDRVNCVEVVISAVPYKSLGDIELESCLGSELSDEPKEAFWSELRGIEWCPVHADPPVKGLPWSTYKQLVASPNAIRPMSQMWMVSSVMYVLDGECDSQYLQCKLGWMDKPSISILSNQLVELSKSYCQLNLESEIVLLSSSLQTEIPFLYSMLQEVVCNDGFSIVKSTLKDVPCIWIGDNFVPPTSLAFDSPVKFAPYLYVVPSELSEFRCLLLALGVKMAFDVVDYIHVLKHLQQDLSGLPLSSEQLDFVLCILEAIADCSADKLSNNSYLPSLIIPDLSGHLVCAEDLIYNDAPWMERNAPIGKIFVHPSVSIELANKLGVQSLRCLSLVDKELTKDLPCMDFAKISELLTSYGGDEYLLFDLLELADCCKATNVHLILDKRQHSKQTLLQHNFGEFQGPALTVVLEGTSLTLEEVRTLQFLPPWKLRGTTLSYGLGILSCYCISHFLAVVSNGHFYIFDPIGKALSVPSSQGPAAKMFSLMGTNLVERFNDQFQPMLINEKNLWFSSNSTVIRMPLSTEFLKEGYDSGYQRLQQVLGRFKENVSKTLLFLKSVFQVTLLTWEDGNLQASRDYSICVDPSSVVMRNPFSEKKWQKFQISRLFGGSNAAIKSRVIDIHVFQGGIKTVEKWLVVLSLGSGQTRNMALDRRYVAYNLTPVGGVAALISRNGEPGSIQSTSCILAPLPLSKYISMPVVILGYFLVCHNGGRCLFDYPGVDESSGWQAPNVGNHLIEVWNKELMCCVRDSYVEMIVELHKVQREPLSSTLEPNARLAICSLLQANGDCIYSFWPKSKPSLLPSELSDGDLSSSSPPFVFDLDWKCLIKQVVRPLYAGLVDQPVWQLYSGKLVKADEGMFLSYSRNDDSANMPPATVCNFVKEHYPVFSVPRELVTEIQAVGVSVREIRPKMVRDLLKASSSSIVLRSVETYVDILDYCLSDIQLADQNDLQHGGFPGGSSIFAHESHEPRGDSVRTTQRASNVYTSQVQGAPYQDSEPLEIMSNLGKVLYDFGRGVMEDIGRAGDSLINLTTTERFNADANRFLEPTLSELRGLPCPTATMHLARLGVTELWIGSKEEQLLMVRLAAMFMHSECLAKESVTTVISNPVICKSLKLQKFSPMLLSNHMKHLFNEQWVTHVMNLNSAPWVSWDCSLPDGGPSREWIQLFWQAFGGSEYVDLFSDWPLIPSFLGRSVLCRVRVQNLVFIPPITKSVLEVRTSGLNEAGSSTTESELMHGYLLAFEKTKSTHPWLFPLLNQCNIPVYDSSFITYGVPKNCLPLAGQSLGQVIISKFLSAKCSGYYPERVIFSNEVCDELFTLFAMDFDSSSGSTYSRELFDVLRTLPIYRTVVGTYVCLHENNRCIISPSSFYKPYDEQCLSYPVDSGRASFLFALGVSELHDQEILLKFALPCFEEKSQNDKEDILLYIYMNWQDLQSDSVISALKETKFVRNADEISVDLYKPHDLFDPCDPLLASIFFGDKAQFPGEKFSGDGWLRILRKTGLRTSLEPDVILECAKKVALLGNTEKCMEDSDGLNPYYFETQAGVGLDVWNLAMSVTDTIFKNLAVLYSNNFCSQLSKIAFVPSLKGFPTIGGKKGGRRVLTSYNEAILSKDWPLAWSSAPILASQNVIPPEYAWGAFQLRSPPAFPTVLHHLQVMGINGGEDTLAHWPASTGMKSIEEASCEVLTYLDSVWSSLSAADISELEKVSFVPVANGTRLVTASSLFTRLIINLSPFAFELPAFCLPFLKILKDIGLQDVLSIAYAKELLVTIQRSRGYQRLNPNELRAVMEILSYICDDTQKKFDESIKAMELIVPDDGCRLVLARSCIYIDSWGYQFVGSIDTSLLRFSHPDLSKKMCATLGIKKLSEVVVEELDHGQELEVLDQFGEVHLDMIKDKLRSESLHASLWSVLKNLSDPSSASEVVNFEQIQRHLKSMADKMKFVRTIHTRFVLYPKVVDITLKKATVVPEWCHASKNRTLHFIDRKSSIFLLAEPPSYISIFDVIAVVVSRILDLICVLPVGCLFSSPLGSEKEIINILKLGSDWNNVGGGSIEKLVGRILLPQDALQVQFHPLRPFYKGEIIAWRSRKEGDKLKYGYVLEDVRPSAGQALYRFKVETGPGEIQHLLSSHIFSFKSQLSTGEGSTSEFRVPSQMHVNNDHLLASNDNGPAKSTFQVTNELQHGRVSSAELVHAVYEMLSAAGINMDVEKKNLLQTALTLQEELRESQAVLLLEQEKADAAVKEAESAKTAWTCRICLNAEIDTALTPCGHVLCNRCSAAISRCPFCRLKVSKMLRIFRP